MARGAQLAFVLAIGAAGVAPAQDADGFGGPTAYVDARQGVMWAMQVASGHFGEEAARDAPVAEHLVEYAEIISGNLRAVPLLFPAGTDKDATPGHSNHASDRIWQDQAGFAAAAETAIAAADAIQAAPDVAALVAAFDRLETACADCHASYLDYDPFEAIADDPPPDEALFDFSDR